ncbi:MAG: sugar ABC transporter permease [Armatimonadota bacterium]|nr:sugar ABC transporter permease [Armatimonadota bacterium]MDR7402314.1 sugar ABC transporter permease [Armatimonadota bacterium]MDR7404379.1 sugar ABC transporter permease [Armatimonadota bacterium]MDR7437299.1 sugar ABC transporter permease [Armatimonadota bacterium]MDR7472638.1 sugar ABC transporter permease [Armatimonadota bacterium]
MAESDRIAAQAEAEVAPARVAAGARVARAATPALFLLPAGVLIALFFLVPVATTLYLSLTDISTLTFRQPRWVGLANYRDLLTDPFLPRILLNTVRYVVLTLLFNVGMGLTLAVLTTAVRPGIGNQARALWLLPRILPPVVYVLVWQGISREAPYGLLGILTGSSRGWITSHPWATVVLANGLVGASFGMLIFTSAIRSISPELFYAAAVDGATTWQTVRRVVLPLLRWPILFVTAYQTLSLLTSFEYILLLTDGGPGFYTTTVWSLHAYKLALSNYYGNVQFGLGAAMAAVLVVVGVVVSVVYLRVFNFRQLVGEPRIEVS